MCPLVAWIIASRTSQIRRGAGHRGCMPLGAGFVALAVAALLILGLLAFDVLTYAYRRDLAHSGCHLPDLLEIVTPALLPPPSWRDIGLYAQPRGSPGTLFPNARRWLIPRSPPADYRLGEGRRQPVAGGAGLGGAARAPAHPDRSWAARRGIRGEQPVWWRPAQRPKVPLVVALASGKALAWPV